MRVGLYGGTFAPLHNGHLAAAFTFYDECRLDKLILIPSRIPPHKDQIPSDDPTDRFRMLLGSVREYRKEKNISVSKYEIGREEVSYSYYTLKHFQKKTDELFFLCGTDMLLTLDKWYRAEELFSLCTFVCAEREENREKRQEILRKKEEYEKRFSASILLLDHQPLEISSTQIREMIGKGEDISSLVPPFVCRYIQKHGLYQK